MRILSDSNLSKKDDALLVEGHIVDAQYFYFETPPDCDQELAIVFGGYEKCAPDFEIYRKTYPYYVLEYATKGRCDLEIDSNRYCLQTGTLAGFAPGIPHHYKCDRTSPLEHFWLAIVGNKAGELFQKSMLTKGVIKLWPEAIQVIEAIMTSSLNKTQFAQQICCHYLRILLLLLTSGSPVQKSKPLGSAITFQKCKMYIDQNFSTVSLPCQVSSFCNVNVRYMSRLFKKHVNLSPHEYISHLKLNKAANLLLTSKLSINQIASAVGFEDPYHFSRNFKNFHGMSPLRYRSYHNID